MKLFLAICLAICIVSVYCEDEPKPAEKEGETKVAEKEDSSEEKEDPNLQICIDENKVDQKMFDDHVKGKTELPDLPEIKCFLACMMKKEGWMTDDGTFTDKFKATKAPEECRHLTGKDACEIAYKTSECLLKHDMPLAKAEAKAEATTETKAEAKEAKAESS